MYYLLKLELMEQPFNKCKKRPHVLSAPEKKDNFSFVIDHVAWAPNPMDDHQGAICEGRDRDTAVSSITFTLSPGNTDILQQKTPQNDPQEVGKPVQK